MPARPAGCGPRAAACGWVFEDAVYRPPRLFWHQRLPLPLADDLPMVDRQARDPRVQQDHPDAGPVPPGGAALGLLRRLEVQLGPLPPDPADRPAAQQSSARLSDCRALDWAGGQVVLAVPERAGSAQEPLAVDRGLLVGQLLPLGLALLLSLSDRDQDPRGEPAGVGAQVDVPLHLGKPDPALSNWGIRYCRSSGSRGKRAHFKHSPPRDPHPPPPPARHLTLNECGLVPVCRHDHKTKQAPGWTLTQPRPGHMTWTTPSGRTYTTDPTSYPD